MKRADVVFSAGALFIHVSFIDKRFILSEIGSVAQNRRLRLTDLFEGQPITTVIQMFSP